MSIRCNFFINKGVTTCYSGFYCDGSNMFLCSDVLGVGMSSKCCTEHVEACRKRENGS